jgi:tetratricopeptide (TPR) repeat protein
MEPINRRRRPSVIASLSVLVLLAAACNVTPQQREARHMAKGNKYFDAKQFKKASIEFKVASQNMPRDAEPIYKLGLTYRAAGAAKAALEQFQKAAVLDPKHEGARYQIALFQAVTNNADLIDLARPVLNSYATAHPSETECVDALAVLEAKLGNKGEVLHLLSQAVERDPSDLHGLSAVVALYAIRADLNAAREIARDIARKLPESPDAAVVEAQVALAAKDFSGADAHIGRALALKRDFAPALELRLRRDLMLHDESGANQTAQQLAELPEKSTWSLYARMLFAEGKYDDGVKEFERVLMERGDPVDVRNEYSALLMDVGRLHQAEVVISATLAKAPKDVASRLQRVKLEIDLRKADAAAKDIKVLLDMNEASAPLSYQQSRLAALNGDKVTQGTLLEDALRRNPRFLRARLNLSELLSDTGKGREALSTLDLASEAEKKTIGYLYCRNQALITAGFNEEARKGVDAGLALRRSPGFLHQDGMLRAALGDLPGARQSLKASFDAQPSNLRNLALLGGVMRKQGDAQTFVTMLQDALGKDPASGDLQNALATELEQQGDLTAARTALEALRAGGEVAEADVRIARIDMQTGALETAKQRLTSLVANHDNSAARMLLAEIEIRRGSSDGAIAHYLKAIGLEPSNVAAMNNLAALLPSSASTSGDALFWALKALARSPSNPIVEDTVGWIYYRQGKYGDALPHLEKSLKSLDRPIAHYHLGAALLKAGNVARGREQYEIAVAKDPRSSAREEVGALFRGQ